MEIRSYGETYKVHIVVSKYQENGNLALSLMTDGGEPFATITKNLSIPLPADAAFIDTNNLPQIEEFIKKYELGEKRECQERKSGFCTYPLYVFDMNKIGGR